jgi:methionine--tRNA ligase beta chain
MIDIEDFAKVEMRVGLVVEATAVEGSEKLIREVVDFGSEKRIIFSGIRKWYQPEDLAGKKFVYVTNLTPRKMLGEESQGMILVAETAEGDVKLVPVSDDIPIGVKVR